MRRDHSDAICLYLRRTEHNHRRPTEWRRHCPSHHSRRNRLLILGKDSMSKDLTIKPSRINYLKSLADKANMLAARAKQSIQLANSAQEDLNSAIEDVHEL